MKTYHRLGPELTEVLSQGTYVLHGDIGNAGFMTFRFESFRTCGLSQEAMNFSSLLSVSTVYFDILCSGFFFLGIPRHIKMSSASFGRGKRKLSQVPPFDLKVKSLGS